MSMIARCVGLGSQTSKHREKIQGRGRSGGWSILILSAFMSWGSIGCDKGSQDQEVDQKRGQAQVGQSQVLKRLDDSLLSGRVTAILRQGQWLYLGEEGGVLRRLPWPSERKRSVDVIGWMAHEGAVRHIRKLSKNSIRSVGADGSWADWSSEGQLKRRGRVSDFHINDILRLGEEDEVIATDRGSVIRVTKQTRRWRTAGEHGRATFGLIKLDRQRLLSVGADGWGRCWLIDQGEACGAVPLHQGWITGVSSFGEMIITGGSDGFIKIWDLHLFEQFNREEKDGHSKHLLTAMTSLRAHDGDLTRLVTHQDLVLTGSEDGRVTLSQVTKGSENKVFLKQRWSRLSPQLKPILSLAFDPDQQRVLVGGGQQAQLWSFVIQQPSVHPTEMLEFTKK